MNKVYVGESDKHGKGIFAKINIKKGEIIFIAKGKIVEFLVRTLKDSLVGPNWVGINKNTWIDPFENNPLYYMNHSCNPNVGIKGRVVFVALKNIKKDEEITFDYSVSEVDIHWQMDCSCRQKNCRKIIRSIQFLPKKIFKKYLPYVPTCFKKVYLNTHKNK